MNNKNNKRPRRRRRGMGSIYEHGTSLYIGYYVNGEQIRERIGPIGLVTKGQAEQALKARMGEVVQGRYNLETHKQSVSFDYLMDEYLKWAKVNHRSPDRDFEISKPLLKYFGGKNLDEITSWVVEQYKSERKQTLKPSTINRELGVLKRMFNLAIQWGLISDNPVIGVNLLPVPKGIPRTLKEWEFLKVYDGAADHFKPILLCAYLTGMRKGEILKLKWDDVDLENNNIIVRESKNNEARVIPFNATLRNELLKLKAVDNSEFVFTTQVGNPYGSKDAFYRAWRTALKNSEIEKCRFHDFRHTFISNLVVNQKEDIITVMEISGHKDIRMLQRYSHTREDVKKEAVRKLGETLNLVKTPSINHTTITSTKK